MTILASPTDASSEWLSSILGSDVEIVANEPITDAGLTSSIARLRLRSEAGQSSVIVKCAPADDGFRARMLWALRGEVLFYRDIGVRSGAPIPHCWYSEFRDEDARCTLVMEDLHPLVPGDSFNGLPYEQGLRCVELIAPMHARYWGDTDNWPWLAETAETTYSRLSAAENDLPFVVQRHGEQLPDSVRAIVPTLVEHTFSPETLARRAAHTTLIHGDFHCGNIAFGDSLDDIRIFDWQAVMAATPGLDLMKLVFIGMTVDQRRSFGDELIDAYRERMSAAGVAIGRDMLRELVHDALVWQMGPLMRIARLAEPGSTFERWTFMLFERMGAALEDGW